MPAKRCRLSVAGPPGCGRTKTSPSSSIGCANGPCLSTPANRVGFLWTRCLQPVGFALFRSHGLFAEDRSCLVPRCLAAFRRSEPYAERRAAIFRCRSTRPRRMRKRRRAITHGVALRSVAAQRDDAGESASTPSKTPSFSGMPKTIRTMARRARIVEPARSAHERDTRTADAALHGPKARGDRLCSITTSATPALRT